MTRRPSPKVRLALLNDVLQLLGRRRRPIHGVLIHPDGTIEIRLAPSPKIQVQEAGLDEVLARFRKENGYE